MDIPLAVTNNVLSKRPRRMHGATWFHPLIFDVKVFWSIHSVEYIRSRFEDSALHSSTTDER